MTIHLGYLPADQLSIPRMSFLPRIGFSLPRQSNAPLDKSVAGARGLAGDGHQESSEALTLPFPSATYWKCGRIENAVVSDAEFIYCGGRAGCRRACLCGTARPDGPHWWPTPVAKSSEIPFFPSVPLVNGRLPALRHGPPLPWATDRQSTRCCRS